MLVSEDGTPKINDFDHAILLDSTLRFSTTTRPWGGTLRWMAPELFQPEDEGGGQKRPPATRSQQIDVYALGMERTIKVFTAASRSLNLHQTMLEILTGAVPYS